jgi:hypothetical protein
MPSFISEQLDQMEQGADDDDLKGAAATMFGAGEATVGISLTFWSPSHLDFLDVEYT